MHPDKDTSLFEQQHAISSVGNLIVQVKSNLPSEYKCQKYLKMECKLCNADIMVYDTGNNETLISTLYRVTGTSNIFNLWS